MAQKMRREIPAAIRNAPVLSETDEYIYLAFIDLNSCRNFEGARIPWTAINAYADAYGIDDPFDHSLRDTFIATICELDIAFLNYMDERRKKVKPTDGGGKNGRTGAQKLRKPRESG